MNHQAGVAQPRKWLLTCERLLATGRQRAPASGRRTQVGLSGGHRLLASLAADPPNRGASLAAVVCCHHSVICMQLQ